MTRACRFDECFQVWRYRHRFKWADIGPTRVARWNQAEGRLGSGTDNSQDLPHAFACIGPSAAPDKHEPVHSNVQKGRGLSEHMGSLEVGKGPFVVATRLGSLGCLDFRIDVRRYALTE